MVFPVRYRQKVFSPAVKETLITVCKEISLRFDIHFLEIGTDLDHVHMLVQSVPNEKISEVVKKIKSITAREIFLKHKEVKIFLWGGRFWTSGYYVNTVGSFGMEEAIKKYVQKQGMEYENLYKDQIRLFD